MGLSQNNICKLRNYLLGWGVFRSRWLICNDEGPRVTKKVMGGRLSFPVGLLRPIHIHMMIHMRDG